MSFRISCFVILLLCTLIFACTDTVEKKGPDVSGIDVQLVVKRFEQDVFSMDSSNMESEFLRMEEQYPRLFPLFTEQIIRDAYDPRQSPQEALEVFLSSPIAREVYDTVQTAYGDLSDLEPKIRSLLQHYRYYFPEKPIPEIMTIISEFSVDAFTYGDSLCGIGLDMFLGPDYRYYDPQIFPLYISRNFTRDQIPVRLARVMAQNLAGAPGGNRLIDQMIHNGKTLYIVESLLPEAPDSLLMGYTREQLEGCVANEQAVWARILDENLLYETDEMRYRKLVHPSPNAPVIFEEAPGEIGNWVGWQIVRAYMRRNPDTDMQSLIDMRDAQELLQASKYKPRRF